MAPAKRGAKRQAEAPAAEVAPAKRINDLVKKHGVSKQAFAAVMEVLEHPLTNELGPGCRSMLAALLPHSLLIPADQRHPAQATAVEMLSEVFSSILSKLQASAAEAAEALARVAASRGGLEAASREAQATAAEAAAVVDGRKTALAETAKEVQEAKAEVARQEQEQAAARSGLESLKADRSALSAVLSIDFARLRDGEYEAGSEQAHFAALKAVADKILTMEESMAKAFPASIMMRPEVRGSFDVMVVDQVGAVLTKKDAELAEAQAAAEAAAAVGGSAVAAAQQAVEAAKEVQQRAADAFNQAQAEHQEIQAAADRARAALQDFEPSHEDAKKTSEAKEIEFDVFRDHNFGRFVSLRDRTSPKAVEPEAQAEAAVAVAGA